MPAKIDSLPISLRSIRLLVRVSRRELRAGCSSGASGFTRLLHRVSVRLSEIRVARRDSADGLGSRRWHYRLGLLALATAIVLHRPGKVAAQDSAKAARGCNGRVQLRRAV